MIQSSLQFGVSINGLTSFKRAIRDAPKVYSKQLQSALRKSGLLIQTKARLYAPVRTGALRRSISYELRPKRLVIGSPLEYAQYQDQGTAAHGPKSSPFMVFKVGGKWVKTKWVKGVKAKHYFGRALRESRRTVDKLIDRAVSFMVTRLTK